MRWLKGWDPCVFGTAPPGQLAQQARGVGSRYAWQGFQPDQQHGERGGGGGSVDALGRPEHKVILIAGPPGARRVRCAAAQHVGGTLLLRPGVHTSAAAAGCPAGLGKTTLAHICAVHCGYRPVEINASDDRSGGVLQSRVMDAVEMQVG